MLESYVSSIGYDTILINFIRDNKIISTSLGVKDEFIDFVYNVYAIYKEFGNVKYYQDMIFEDFYEMAKINKIGWQAVLFFIRKCKFATIKNNVITFKDEYIRS